jgi:hypothetical protein
VKKGQIRPRKGGSPAKSGGENPKSLFTVKNHVGLIPPIVPGGKIYTVFEKGGHNAEKSPGAQQPIQEEKGLPGMMKVLRRLGTDDEIIGLFKNLPLGKEEGVVVFHGMSFLFEKPGEERCGAASEIEPLAFFGKRRQNRVPQPSKKAGVSLILQRVIVQSVPGKLGFLIRKILGIHKNRLAVRTSIVAFPLQGKKKIRSRVFTNRADRGKFPRDF